jgi:hypothetical protein
MDSGAPYQFWGWNEASVRGSWIAHTLAGPANLRDAITKVTSPQGPQCDPIGVIDAGGNLIDTLVSRL